MCVLYEDFVITNNITILTCLICMDLGLFCGTLLQLSIESKFLGTCFGNS